VFTTPLNLTALTPDLWAVASPLVWEDEAGRIVVPKGFVTDLASIPHVIDWIPILDRTGLSRRPAALHDWCYAGRRQQGKDAADNLLRKALMAEGMSAAGASVYYYGVHWFGGPSWASDARKSSNGRLTSGDFYTGADYLSWRAGTSQ